MEGTRLSRSSNDKEKKFYNVEFRPLTKCRSTSFESVDKTTLNNDVSSYKTWSHQDSKVRRSVKKFQDIWEQDQNTHKSSGVSDSWSQNQYEVKSSGAPENIYFAYPVVLDPDLDEEQEQML